MAKVSPIPVDVRRNRFDPVDELNQLRRQAPVTRMETVPGLAHRPAWLVTGHDEVRAVLGDTSRFRTRPPADTEEDAQRLIQPGNLLHYDPPEHGRLRKLFTPEFTVKRMRRLEPRIEAIVAEFLDTMAEAGPPVDLMRQFAQPVPGMVICELLGVPRDDHATLARFGNLLRDGTRPREQRMSAGTALLNYFSGQVARQRKHPDEELLGMLVREHGDDLTDDDLTGFATALMNAGLDNTSGMIGLGVLLLLEHPDQFALLREHPDLMASAVEELLRYISVIPTASPRTAVADTVLAGELIREGDRVKCSLMSANRDPAVCPDPDRLDITREPGPHVAFGHGIHHCLGAPLARMEMRMIYQALFQRFPGIRLAVPPDQVRFRVAAAKVVFSVEALPVAW
jgi:cytochrome P450